MLAIAFKEWAGVCRALGDGRQAVILRKGGVAEAGGDFRPAHARFFLYPTFFHEQHRAGVRPEFLPLLDAAEADHPPPGVVRLSHFAEVASVRHVTSLDRALALAPYHGWTAETVRQRFAYRTPGLYVFTIRAFRLPEPVDVTDRPEYAGCKTWVEFDAPVPTAGAVPVLADEAFAAVSGAIEGALAGGPI